MRNDNADELQRAIVPAAPRAAVRRMAQGSVPDCAQMSSR